MPKFKITYALNGTRAVEITLPEGTKMPEDWQDMSMDAKDEWLFGVQSNSKMLAEDIDYAEALSIALIE